MIDLNLVGRMLLFTAIVAGAFLAGLRVGSPEPEAIPAVVIQTNCIVRSSHPASPSGTILTVICPEQEEES